MRLRGYTMPLVILVLGTLATAMTLMVFVLGASAKTTGSMLGRRETLYACDGIIRGLMVKSRDYFAETPVPTAAGLRDHLCGPLTAPGCPPTAGWIPEFEVESVTATTGEFDKVEEVPTGPFRGQMARRTDIELTVIAKKATTAQRCRVSQTAINSEIGLFQFAVFSAMPIELLSPPTMDIRGRVHVNGDFLAGGSNPLIIEKVTASGRIFATSSGYAIRNSTNDNPVAISSGNDGDSSGWRVNSENTWHGNAQDVSWGVPSLRLPVATSATTQGGNDANGTTRSNSGMLRLLVDPPRTDDDAATADERLANKAAIRIINGVWYKNDGSTFPGTPIWSDHPATYDTGNISTEEVALIGPTVAAAIPTSRTGAKRYSHYETASATGLMANDNGQRSVVSYGPLAFDGGTWKPGFMDGGTLKPATNDAELARGTRSGFIDRRVSRSALGDGIGRTLPLNFDVGAFVEALNDTDAGELGAHFPTGLGADAIVWIGNTWPGWLDGFPDGIAGQHPAEPLIERSTLPLPLCGIGDDPEIAAGVAKQNCSGLVGATAVRVWNAQTIDPAVLPRGLTIATNAPMYVLGNTNTASLTAGAPGLPRAEVATGNWVPLLVAGDAVSLLSNAWRDAPRHWGATVNDYTNPCGADAADTTFVTAVLGGHLSMVGLPGSATGSGAGGGINNFPRFLECWSGKTATIHGSLVAGFRSVYQDQGFSVAGPYMPPNRTWKFDPNLAKPANQPPGTPSFFVSAVERWQRD